MTLNLFQTILRSQYKEPMYPKYTAQQMAPPIPPPPILRKSRSRERPPPPPVRSTTVPMVNNDVGRTLFEPSLGINGASTALMNDIQVCNDRVYSM